MTAELLADDTDTTRTSRGWWVPGMLVAALVGAALTAWLLAPAAPDDASPEAGFARDMSVHHAQAVEMAGLIRDRTEDPDLRFLAEDIMLSQQNQIGQMRAWLALWGLPAAGRGEPMTWMGMGGMPMAGMATMAQVDDLRQADGVEAERLFLELMIEHHRGGVAMADAVLDRTDDPVVSRLAAAMSTGQASEIELMERLLAERRP